MYKVLSWRLEPLLLPPHPKSTYTYEVTITPKICGNTSQVTSNNNTYHIISKYRKSIVQTAGTLTKNKSYHSHKTRNHSHTSQLIKQRWRVCRCQQNKTNPSHWLQLSEGKIRVREQD